MTAPIDFTACERLPGRAYNGANGKKIAVAHDGATWLLKFPPSAADKPTTLSCTNSCISEHIASTIANMVELKSHETRLGTFTNGKTKAVCACRDFTADGKINHVDFVRENRDGVLAPSIARILPRIDMGTTGAFIDDAPLITGLQRRFYKTYISSRYEALFGQ